MIETGMVVKSKAGHDAGRFFIVVKTEGEFAYLADGRYRPLEKPKKKRGKHLAPTLRTINLECPLTDKELRKALADLNGGRETEGGSDLGKR